MGAHVTDYLTDDQKIPYWWLRLCFWERPKLQLDLALNLGVFHAINILEI